MRAVLGWGMLTWEGGHGVGKGVLWGDTRLKGGLLGGWVTGLRTWGVLTQGMKEGRYRAPLSPPEGSLWGGDTPIPWC